jgi:hypothetical protein
MESDRALFGFHRASQPVPEGERIFVKGFVPFERVRPVDKEALCPFGKSQF